MTKANVTQKVDGSTPGSPVSRILQFALTILTKSGKVVKSRGGLKTSHICTSADVRFHIGEYAI